MPKALVISLHFNPGHVSHLRAGYRQLEELGYESWYLVHRDFQDFLPRGSRVLIYGEQKIPASEVAIFFFPSEKNLRLILQLKRRYHSKIVYCFHEPLAPMKVYRESGFSYAYLAKLWLINRISSLTVRWSNAILLPSQKAVELYKANSLYKNPYCLYLPLLYDDERTAELAATERRYFSYIGTVSADHSFGEFLRFVEWAVKEGRLPQLEFLIATKSEFEVPQALQDSPRVSIRKGRPLSDEEINACYASSYAVWNAYTRTTQSGVLAKSFMFGTPAVVMKKNLSEFTTDGQEVVAIEDNTSLEAVEKAILQILEDFDHYTACARERFLKSFYYRQYNTLMGRLLMQRTAESLAPQYEAFIQLVRLGIGHGAKPIQGPVDWGIVGGLAVYHQLAAVASDGLDALLRQDSSLQGPDEELKGKWMSQALGCELRYERCKETLAQMAAFYRSHGIKMMVLKGYSLSLDWPVPKHRTTGDIDIWLFGRQKEADALVEQEKGIAIDRSHHHHTVFYWGKAMVENHFDFINVHYHRSHVQMEKLFKELGQDDSRFVEIDGEKVYVANPKLAALFLLRHTMLHFISYGFSFRQLLDWGFMAKSHGEELDWPWLLERLEEFGMLRMFHICNAILIEDFGFDESLFPPVQADAALKERVRKEMYYPPYRPGAIRAPLFKRLRYALRRWKDSLWKHRLCYRESLWSVFWSTIWNHIVRPEAD